MGNCNAKLGINCETSNNVTLFGIGVGNENGKKMKEFAIYNHLKIAGTYSYFRKRENKRWAWLSPDQNAK